MDQNTVCFSDIQPGYEWIVGVVNIITIITLDFTATLANRILTIGRWWLSYAILLKLPVLVKFPLCYTSNILIKSITNITIITLIIITSFLNQSALVSIRESILEHDGFSVF